MTTTLRSIVRPLRVCRFSNTVNFPQSTFSSVPGQLHDFSFAKPCRLPRPSNAKKQRRPPRKTRPIDHKCRSISQPYRETSSLRRGRDDDYEEGGSGFTYIYRWKPGM